MNFSIGWCICTLHACISEGGKSEFSKDIVLVDTASVEPFTLKGNCRLQE
jgi:hypothetical protein